MDGTTEKPKRKSRRRYSTNAGLVAKDVVAQMQAGKKVVLAPILRRHGYSEGVVKNPDQVTYQSAYKEVVDTYVQRLERHRLKIVEAMEKKDLDAEQYRTLTEAQTKVTHDVQLLSGGKTENVGIEKDRETLKAIVAAIQIDG